MPVHPHPSTTAGQITATRPAPQAFPCGEGWPAPGEWPPAPTAPGQNAGHHASAPGVKACRCGQRLACPWCMRLALASAPDVAAISIRDVAVISG